MKNERKLYLIVVCVLSAILSCNEKPEELTQIDPGENNPPWVSVPLEFDVEIDEGSSLKIGEPVTFRLKGNAHLVRFYSGDFKNAYEYHDRDRFQDVSVAFSFETQKFGPAHTHNSSHTGILLYSTDFDGIYNYTNVEAADWKPITDRFTISELVTLSPPNFTPSGTEPTDMTDIFEEKTFYLAWYCKAEYNTIRTGFRCRSFKIDAIVEDDPSLSNTLYVQENMGFQWVLNPVAVDVTTGDQPYVNNQEIRWIWNSNTTPTQGGDLEGYAVSIPMELPQYSLGKDGPTVFSTEWDNGIMDYPYTYNKAGEYEVVFIASNINTNDREEVIRSITIRVEDIEKTEEE